MKYSVLPDAPGLQKCQDLGVAEAPSASSFALQLLRWYPGELIFNSLQPPTLVVSVTGMIVCCRHATVLLALGCSTVLPVLGQETIEKSCRRLRIFRQPIGYQLL